MFSEWTASRAASKRLEDVIRKQWAVPSTHNPPTWERVRLSVSAPNLMISVTLHPPDYEKQSLLLRSGKCFSFFCDTQTYLSLVTLFESEPQRASKYPQTRGQVLLGFRGSCDNV